MEPRIIDSWVQWIAGALLIAGAGLMLPHGGLHDFGTVPWFLAGAGVMLAGFFMGHWKREVSWQLFWIVAVMTRVVLLWQVPGNDIYRYLWEGRMLLIGENPYVHPPSSEVLSAYRDSLWEMVQHKNYTAIYPPLTQVIFAAWSAVGASAFVFKLLFALADLTVVGLLAKRFGAGKSLIYAWNPLVIYSFAGGGHYDALFVLALLAGWFAWDAGKWRAGVLWVGVAVAIKWMALPLLAWMGWRLVRTQGWLAGAGYGVAGIAPLMLSWLVVCGWSGEWTLQLLPPKFSQHARSADLIPALAGLIWEEAQYQNQWFLIPLAAGWAVVIFSAKRMEVAALWVFVVMFVLTPMVHAWYFTWMIPFVVNCRNAGVLAVSASGFVYFMLYHHVEAPGGDWLLSPWELALLWAPLVMGFVYSELWRGREPQ